MRFARSSTCGIGRDDERPPVVYTAPRVTILLNLILGFVPTLILGASIAAGIEDDANHRRVFLLVYALWAFTLAGWNWLESSHVAWVMLWGAFGITAMVWLAATRARTSGGR
jgi:hypothetical protein